ncbi:MAG: HAD-IA family hydrolase [Bacteroidetes bacterium]|nr:HAD-IA family hydrolase [Bacteroidota bacterium]
MKQNIKAIIFDVDGVLLKNVDDEGKFLWSKDLKKDLKIGSNQCKIIFSNIWKEVTKGKLDTIKHLDEVFKHSFFKNINILPKEFVDYWLSKDIFIIEEMLNLVKSLSHKCYIGSNQDLYRGRYIKKLIGKYFEKCFISAEMGYNKPNPKFYSYIEKELNLKPNQILFVDDNDENIESAKNKGWHTYLYKEDFKEFKQYLQRFNILIN